MNRIQLSTKVVSLSIGVVLLFLGSCSKKVTEPEVIEVTGVTLNKTSTTILVGNTEQLTATISPTNATNKNATWSSDNGTVASVSTSGLVSALTVGTTVITVTTEEGSYTATCSVTVSPVVAEVTLTSAGLSHTMVLKGDRSLWVMDRNDRGQLGDSTTTDRHTPVEVMTGVLIVSAG